MSLSTHLRLAVLADEHADGLDRGEAHVQGDKLGQREAGEQRHGAVEGFGSNVVVVVVLGRVSGCLC